MAFTQGTGQGFTVHRSATAGIDEDSIRLHALDALIAHQTVGFRRAGKYQRCHIAFCQQVVQLIHRVHRVNARGRLVHIPADAQGFGAKGLAEQRKAGADVPGAADEHLGAPQGLGSTGTLPDLSVLVVPVVGQTLHQSHQHGEHVLRNRDAVCAHRRGEHSACGQDTFGHILIGAGAAGVHPAQGSAAFPYSSDRRVAQQHSGAFEISGSDVAVPEKDLLHTGGSSQECFLLLRGEDQGVDDFFHGKTSLFCRTGRCLGWGAVPGFRGAAPVPDRNASFRRLTALALLYHGAQRNGIIDHWDGSRQSLRIVRS